MGHAAVVKSHSNVAKSTTLEWGTRDREREYSMKCNLICNRKMMWVMVVIALALTQASAQILTSAQVKKIAPASFFFSGQSAVVQGRNTAGLKNSGGKAVLAGLVDTTGYATAIAEKFQGFLITETKLSFDGATLDPGAYGFGFKEGKFTVMNVAGTDVFSIASKNDDQLKHPVPLKFEKDSAGYRLYAGRQYVVVKAD
jgi:hypothetical protein